MRIIIDGCDGTGKTVLSEFIAKKTGRQIKKFSYPRSDDPFYEFLPWYLKETQNDIFDRCWIDEIIYGPMKGRKGLTKKQIEVFRELTKDDLYIITHTSIERIKESFQVRGEDYIDLEEAKKINNFFLLEVPKILTNGVFYDVKSDGTDLEKFFKENISVKLQ